MWFQSTPVEAVLGEKKKSVSFTVNKSDGCKLPFAVFNTSPASRVIYT